jgi:hypothetical protein
MLLAFSLHRIHKSLFDTVEDDTAEENDQQHETKAVQQVVYIYRTRTQEGITKSLDDGSHRVGQDDPLETCRDGGDRVNDRRGIHQ